MNVPFQVHEDDDWYIYNLDFAESNICDLVFEFEKPVVLSRGFIKPNYDNYRFSFERQWVVSRVLRFSRTRILMSFQPQIPYTMNNWTVRKNNKVTKITHAKTSNYGDYFWKNMKLYIKYGYLINEFDKRFDLVNNLDTKEFRRVGLDIPMTKKTRMVFLICKSKIFSARFDHFGHIDSREVGFYKFFSVDESMGLYCISFDRFIIDANTLYKNFARNTFRPSNNFSNNTEVPFTFCVSKFRGVDFHPVFVHFYG